MIAVICKSNCIITFCKLGGKKINFVEDRTRYEFTFQKSFLSTTEYHDTCIKIIKCQYMKKDMHEPLST